MRSVRAGVVLAAAVLVAACGDGGRRERGTETAPEVGTGPCVADQRFDPGADHVASPRYSVEPPAGGEHLPAAAPPGVYEQAPPDGNIVHAMEHGFVVLWHRPDAGEAVQGAIQSLVSQFRRELLVVPRPGMDVPIAMTAWHQRLLCEEPDEDQLAAFVRTHRDQGPETGFL